MYCYFSRAAVVAALLVVSSFVRIHAQETPWRVVHSENQASCVTSGDTLRLWAAGDLMVVDTTVARSRNLSLEFTVVPGHDRPHLGAGGRYGSPRAWV